jgi:hypothetical protein
MLYPAELRARVARTLARQHPKASPAGCVFPGLSTLNRFDFRRRSTAAGQPQEPAAFQPVEIRSMIKKAPEDAMNRLAIAMLLLASPAFAQGTVAPDALRDCPPIGQTAKGEMVYSLDCKALKAENRDTDYKPNMPATNLRRR